MKLAYIRNRFPKQSETFIMSEVLALKDLGHDITVFARGCELERLDARVVSNRLFEHIIYEPVRMAPWRATVRQFLGKLRSPDDRQLFFLNLLPGYRFADHPGRLQARQPWHAFATRWFFVAKYAILLGNLSLARKHYLDRLAASQVPDYDLMHCPFLFEWDCYKLVDLYRKHSTPPPYTVALRSRDLYSRNVSEKFSSGRDRLITGAASIIAISDYNAEQAVRRFGLQVRPLVIHSSINTLRFTRTPGIEREAGAIVCVARLVEKKGLDLLLAAVYILASQGLSFHLKILGDGPLRGKLQQVIKQRKLEQYIELTGAVSYAQVHAELDRCAMFVLPCKVANDGDRDMLPNSIKEAMAMELPVVTCRTDGIEELIIDQQTGFLAEPNDPLSLAKKMAWVLRYPDEAVRMGSRARQHVVKSFDIGSQSALLCEEFVRLTRTSPVPEEALSASKLEPQGRAA